jgi:hypothetical protein
VREQYPLDLQDTTRIAMELGIPHPGYKKGTTFELTTDFLITVKKGNGVAELARTIKPSHELRKLRVIQKFEIERVYWETRGIDWGIVTENEIDAVLAKNIENIYPYRDINLCSPLTEDIISQLLPLLRESSSNERATLSEITTMCDAELGLGHGISLIAVWHLIANNILQVNMHNQIDPCKRMHELGITFS